MKQLLKMILSFRLEAAYCIVVVEHSTVMQTHKKHMYGLVSLCLRACVHL